ncbi:DEAD/DEAH box helicase [uncultured Polaribacter sp.]|uniref:DEAD/DEAH box helicase n=1 Tax=uncultured Polaribacter sp. TaxID=174711 RepID=UPI0030DC1593|tara:strand:+ start:19150 stop:19764 length:615 start_codon:yes stop_codon:yes gene_type:complete
MAFKKLHSDILEMLEYLDITTPTAFQSASIPVIKSGANIYCTAPKGSGKTTTMILTTLQKLKCEPVGTAPRAIILVEDRDRAAEVNEAFFKYLRHHPLRVYLCDEKLHIDVIKSEVFEGVDILIATPKTLNKLFLLEGVNTTQLKIFNMDDAAFLEQKIAHNTMLLLTESIQKCQFVIYTDKMHPFLKRYESYFMKHPKVISIK